MDVGLLMAVFVSAAAAITDCRTGEIPNWITIPPALAAPVAHGGLLGPRAAMASLASMLLCAAIPYALFRQGSMGGGDVKLFACIGALTGTKLATGLEIQLVSFTSAALLAIATVPWWRGRERTLAALRSPVRLGAPIFFAVACVAIDDTLQPLSTTG